MMPRALFERFCRVTALTAILVALLLRMRAYQRDAQHADSEGWQTLPADAKRMAVLLWNAAISGERDTLRLRVERLPPIEARQLLGSFMAGGRTLAWADGTEARGLAASMFRLAGPDSAWRVLATRSGASAISLRDDGGRLDSLARPRGGIAAWRLSHVQGAARVRAGRSEVQLDVAEAPPSGPGGSAVARSAARRIRLVATPGWEAKFVAAALEEGGWAVDGRLPLAPTAAALLGQPGEFDPTTTAAVIVLDSTAADVDAVRRYVRLGGGLVLTAEAAERAAWRALVPARVGAVRSGIAGALVGEAPREGLDVADLVPDAGAIVLVSDAVQRDGGRERILPRVVARREGEGRVLLSAYRDSWRWRMQGGDDGAGAHRRWWLGLLEATTGFGPRGEEPPSEKSGWPGAEAPYADLVARIGPSTAVPPAAEALAKGASTRVPWLDAPVLPPLLFLLALGALLTEWGSRRLRGAR